MATKFWTKSAITRFVYEISRRSLRITGGFRGWAIEGCQKTSTTTNPRCYGNEIWDIIVYNSAWPLHSTWQASSRRRRRSLDVSTCDLLFNRNWSFLGARRKTFGCRAFSVASPSVWNVLPDSLRDPELTLDISGVIWRLYLHVILDVSHVQRIRDFLVMRYINVRFTYLLTYLLEYKTSRRPFASNWWFWGRAIQWCHTNSTTTDTGCHGNEIRDKVGYITRLVYEISRRSLRPTKDFRCIGLLNDVIEILPRLTLVAMAMKFETK